MQQDSLWLLSSIVHALGRTDVANDRVANVKSEPSVIDRPAFVLELGVERFIRFQAGENCDAAVYDVVVVFGRCVPECHHGIADEFIDRAARRYDGIG